MCPFPSMGFKTGGASYPLGPKLRGGQLDVSDLQASPVAGAGRRAARLVRCARGRCAGGDELPWVKWPDPRVRRWPRSPDAGKAWQEVREGQAQNLLEPDGPARTERAERRPRHKI